MPQAQSVNFAPDLAIENLFFTRNKSELMKMLNSLFDE